MLEKKYTAFQEKLEGMATVFGDRIRRVDAHAAREDAPVFSEIQARLEGRAVMPRLIICGAPGS